MIVARRLALYDVDLYGAGILVALLIAGYAGVARPLSAAATETRDLRRLISEHAVAHEQLHMRLTQIRGQSEQLANVMLRDAAGAPAAESVSQFLTDLTRIAAASDLRVEQVTPQPARRSGPWSVIDIGVVASGRSAGFLRLVDELASLNRYHAFVEFQLSADPAAADTCRLSWTLRLYLPASSGYSPAELKP